MKPHVPLAACVLALAAAARGADAPRPEKDRPLDTSFLKLYAETRGFLNGRPTKPKIAPDGKTVFFLRSEAKSGRQKLFAFDVATKEAKLLLAPETLLAGGDENLSLEEKARRERQRVTAGGFADYHPEPAGGRILVPHSGRLFVFDRGTGTAKELKTGGGVLDPKWSPDGSKVSYVRGYDVYVYDLAADKESAVTAGGTTVKTHGLAEFVAQEEMHRHTGYWWSPDSKFIAYEEADHTGVEVWTTADPFKPGVKPPEQFYPRPGKQNVSVRLGVVPVAGGPTVWVEWDRGKYEYLARVQWEKYGPLTVHLQTRDQRMIGLYKTDPQSGKMSPWCLLKTQDKDHWLNLDQYDVRWASSGRAVLFRGAGLPWIDAQSRGADQPDLVYTQAHFADIDNVVTYDADTGGGLFQASGHPHWTQIFRIKPGDRGGPLRLRDVVQLTHGTGFHTAAGTDQLPVITTTTPTSMPVTDVVTPDGKHLGTLPSVAAEPGFMPNVEFAPNPPAPKLDETGWAQSRRPADDTPLSAVVRPRAFDPKKKYPVIVDVYGGPRHLHVVQAMRNWLIPQWLADQGFVVVAIDNRGTPGRGRDWERAVYQKFGTVPLEDQVAGLRALGKQFPELDLDRVGIVGWSFGGYMAANGVLRRPDVFKAAVAGAPVTDWEDYDTHYTERYMGLLPESRRAYEEASLIPLAKDLSRPLLLVHGTADDNVYFRHTLKLADALFRAGKEFEVLPLPGVTHMYTADPQVAERLWERSVRFFKTHLGEPK